MPLDDSWDKCKLLSCSECKTTEGCGFCRASYGKWDYSECQAIDSSGERVCVCVCAYILYHMMCINFFCFCLFLTLIAIGKCQKSFALLEDSLLGADEPCPACQELECDACIKSTSCSWCRLPVASTGLAVFGCESGLTCKASFAGFGVKPLTNVTACNVSYNDLNLDALKDVLQKVRFVFSVFFSLVFRFSLTFVYR